MMARAAASGLGVRARRQSIGKTIRLPSRLPSHASAFCSAFRLSSRTSNRARARCHDASAPRPGCSSGRAAYHQPALPSGAFDCHPSRGHDPCHGASAVPEGPRALPVMAGSDIGSRGRRLLVYTHEPRHVATPHRGALMIRRSRRGSSGGCAKDCT
jgi:hypothetical protein